MIRLETERLRGLVMHRRLRVGPLVYEFDRGSPTTREVSTVSADDSDDSERVGDSEVSLR